ncbi:MAG: hypothetical protein ABOK23_07800 [Candidatus Methanoperedens sp.]|nr:hypothetical protein [Candidatus Methanoperedens sp.]MCZ7394925.1 hypothetical protein [Candidatus Methanoperedens sp.]
MAELSEDQKTNLRFEYEKTQDMVVHFDTINWTIGSIFIAGIFLMIGTAGDKIQIYPFLAIFSFIGLLVWRLFYHRHKAIIKVKFKRLHYIEQMLDLKQHRQVDEMDHPKADAEISKWWIIRFLRELGRGDRYADILTLGIPTALLLIWFGQGMPK